MWLLHSRALRLEAFFDSDIPRYAILSHRWGKREASFQKLQRLVGTESDTSEEETDDEAMQTDVALIEELTGTRFWKIEKTRQRAREDGIDWIWVDTCCINKGSSAELSEAINSMYAWYQRAERCYVYLWDVAWSGPPVFYATSFKQSERQDRLAFNYSDWFTRGWTLQELLAPSKLFFYDKDWRFIGTRYGLAEEIVQITGVPSHMIERTDNVKELLNDFSIAQKFSWVSRRRTTRKEDMAYCLLGLFHVNMPLLYGEGDKAFLRLQLEIIKNSDDESVFAWRRDIVGECESHLAGITSVHIESTELHRAKRWEFDQYLKATQLEVLKERGADGDSPSQYIPHSGLLAQEPYDFAESGGIVWRKARKYTSRTPYSMTNQGLQFFVKTYPSQLKSFTYSDAKFDILLNCCEPDPTGNPPYPSYRPIVITLRKEVAGDEQYWRRDDCRSFQGPFNYVPQTRILGKDGMWTAPEARTMAFYIRQDAL